MLYSPTDITMEVNGRLISLEAGSLRLPIPVLLRYDTGSSWMSEIDESVFQKSKEKEQKTRKETK